MTLRIFSYGGGWQSNAALVLAAQGRIDFTTFVFADVGSDSEKPETVAYIEDYARPFAEANGIELITVRRTWADGRPFESIYAKMLNAPEGKLREPIPVRGQNGKPFSRSCTLDWKVATIGKWAVAHGASPDDPCITGLGYTLDEVERVNPARALAHEILTWPLIGAPAGYDTGLRLRRADCPAIITAAGLPVPPSSNCWFCPMHNPEQWYRMRQEHPGRFARSVELEATLNARRDALGKPRVYLTRFGVPLDVAIPDGVQPLPFLDDDLCNTGGCFT
jgi:hypothetical protein